MLPSCLHGPCTQWYMYTHPGKTYIHINQNKEVYKKEREEGKRKGERMRGKKGGRWRKDGRKDGRESCIDGRTHRYIMNEDSVIESRDSLPVFIFSEN